MPRAANFTFINALFIHRCRQVMARGWLFAASRAWVAVFSVNPLLLLCKPLAVVLTPGFADANYGMYSYSVARLAG
ncbi:MULTISPECIES: hypothetical protein [Tenebrionibacter/Tenebrionicola group]|uniref:Uncharacterized protein n=2 Tax=Tenebrionibacter/Tenebrionicola group TaxID=2969848 RepID=A0A8K0V9Q3_9ENTR|nr:MULTISPECIES: hypothetical protein [Tenebrionibacter/Tenebrionicola group]MBK4716770.1 hypothetical protein [Tenebrionibacter intestinalis]MBV5096838.1 hypothetical protein [Tenebrionicola larvae]